MAITVVVLLGFIALTAWSASYTYMTGGSPNSDRAEIEKLVREPNARIVRIAAHRLASVQAAPNRLPTDLVFILCRIAVKPLLDELE